MSSDELKITAEQVADTILNVEDTSYWEKRPRDDARIDWRTGGDWISEYWNSQSHPHRQLIIDALQTFPDLDSVVEIGCNCGPNLARIKKAFPHIELAGTDINADAIAKAKELLPEADIRLNDARNGLPWMRMYDVAIVDAVLMYLNPQEVSKALFDISCIARRGIIIVDWYDESINGTVKDGHWARNYPALLEHLGLKVATINLTPELWPNERWAKHGRVFIGKVGDT